MTDTIVINDADERAIKRGRYVCPSCGAKGCGYAPHPHAIGWKEYSRIRCRYCRTEAKINQKEPSR